MIQRIAERQAPPRLSTPSLRPAATPASTTEVRDEVTLAGDRRAEAPEASLRPDSNWTRALALSLAGLAGLGAATFAQARPVQTVQQQETVNTALEGAFAKLESALAESRQGDLGQQAEGVARGALDAVAQHGSRGLEDALRRHPAVTLALAATAGPEASGVSLDRLDLPTDRGAAAFSDAVRQHPLVAGVLSNAAAGPVARLLTEHAAAEASPAEVPHTPAAFRLTHTLDRLEAQGGASREALGPAVRAYLSQPGTTPAQVQAMLMDHPEVSASLVSRAGGFAQDLLESAGVPASVARAAARILAEQGPSRVGDTLAEHPFSARAVAGGLARGAAASLGR